jgi:hypothetical protein
MATFEMTKDVGDTQEPKLLPIDWYPCEITKDPTKEDNNVKKAVDAGQDVEDPDKAGQNLVLNVKVLSDVPEYNNRPFRLWLPFPNEADAGRYTPLGQTMEDAKTDRIAEFVSAFNGEDAEGRQVSLNVGQKAMLHIVQGPNQAGTGMQNSINTFSGAKPIDGDGAVRGDQDIPF